MGRAAGGVVRRTTQGVSVAALVGLSSLPALLRKMTQEFESRGRLSRATTGWMYAEYFAHATIHAATLTKGGRPGTRVSRSVGGGLIAAGGLLGLGGMTRFSGPGQVSGTTDGVFVTDGVYALTRNPQYLGYLAVLAGGAVARRSASGLVLTVAAAAVLDRWILVEERHLRRTHGSAYDQYVGRTARWLDATRLRSLWRTGHRGWNWVGSSA